MWGGLDLDLWWHKPIKGLGLPTVLRQSSSSLLSWQLSWPLHKKLRSTQRPFRHLKRASEHTKGLPAVKEKQKKRSITNLCTFCSDPLQHRCQTQVCVTTRVTVPFVWAFFNSHWQYAHQFNVKYYENTHTHTHTRTNLSPLHKKLLCVFTTVRPHYYNDCLLSYWRTILKWHWGQNIAARVQMRTRTYWSYLSCVGSMCFINRLKNKFCHQKCSLI